MEDEYIVVWYSSTNMANFPFSLFYIYFNKNIIIIYWWLNCLNLMILINSSPPCNSEPWPVQGEAPSFGPLPVGLSESRPGVELHSSLLWNIRPGQLGRTQGWDLLSCSAVLPVSQCVEEARLCPGWVTAHRTLGPISE